MLICYVIKPIMACTSKHCLMSYEILIIAVQLETCRECREPLSSRHRYHPVRRGAPSDRESVPEAILAASKRRLTVPMTALTGVMSLRSHRKPLNLFSANPFLTALPNSVAKTLGSTTLTRLVGTFANYQNNQQDRTMTPFYPFYVFILGIYVDNEAGIFQILSVMRKPSLDVESRQVENSC